MKIIHNNNELKNIIHDWHKKNDKIGFVPTMGNLHAGHLKLVTQSCQNNDHTVVSIFVNPIQFGANEDFAQYPRTFANDCAQLKTIGCDIVFHPSVEDIYPDPLSATTQVQAAYDFSHQLCGASRAGHFNGVCTIMNQLLNLVSPTHVYMGEKDRQQLMIVSKMVRDFHLNCHVIPVSTMREDNGLALSSRNQYLSQDAKYKAALIYQLLNDIATALKQGNRHYASLEAATMIRLDEAGFVPDYCKILRADNLLPDHDHTAATLAIFIAAQLEKTRLIDNITVTLSAT